MTAPKPVVTREHRSAAVYALSTLPGEEAARWIERGWRDPVLSPIALAIAEAEARGAERERASATAELSRLELDAHKLQDRAGEAALYNARLRISSRMHINASDAGEKS